MISLRSKWSIAVWPVVVFTVAAGAILYVLSIERQRLEAELRKDILRNATNMLLRLESELNSNLYLATGLIGYVAAHRDLDPARVQVALSTLYRNGRHLRNVGIAPGNRLTYIYPLAGNEDAVGLFYPDLPDQWPMVQRAINERRTILAGPLPLVQGGIGLISRTPVFLSDGSYWGLVSLVIDSEALFTHAELQERAGSARFALRGRDGKGAAGEVFFGDAELFAGDATVLSLQVPGGEWQLAAAPIGGWTPDQGMLTSMYALGFMMAALLAWLTYRMGIERERNAQLALHDVLTGLPNLRLLNDRLQNQLALAQRGHRGFTLLFLDLDAFKPVNDRLGHREGDKVLKEVAQRLQAAARRSDTVARVGGDEFVVLLPDSPNEESAETVVQKLRAAIAEPVALADGTRCVLRVSIGISVYPRDGTTPDDLIRAADHAMYQDKPYGPTLDLGNPTVTSAR